MLTMHNKELCRRLLEVEKLILVDIKLLEVPKIIFKKLTKDGHFAWWTQTTYASIIRVKF